MFDSPIGGGFDLQLISHILGGLPAETVGWIAVAGGLAAFGLLLRLGEARKDRQNTTTPERPGLTPEPGSDWQKVMDVSLGEIDRVPDLQSLQAHAALQIDAAEHAFNRLLTDCAKVGTPNVAPRVEPVPELPRETAEAPAKPQPPESLAA